MWGLTEVLWLLAALAGTWALVGFTPHLWRPERPAAWWFALVVVLLLAKAGGRSLYWDGLPLILGAERAVALQIAMGGTDVNWVFNLLALIAGYAALKLLHLLIPVDERHLYSPWSAPLYPRRLSFMSFIGAMREGRRIDRDDKRR